MKKHAFKPLDAEEAALMAEIARGERDQELPPNHPVYGQIRQAAKNTFRTKPISFRIAIGDLVALKAKALREGVPYQLLIKKAVHEYLMQSFSSTK